MKKMNGGKKQKQECGRALITFGLLSFLSIPFAGLGISDAQTLEESAGLTLQNHPAVLASKAAALRSEYVVDGAWAGFLPRLDVSGNAGYGKVENSTTRARALADGLEDEDKSNSPYGYSIRMTQELFSGMRTKNSIDAAEYNRDSASHELIAIKEAMALKTAEVYLAAVRAERVLALSKENVSEHQSILEKQQNRYNQGTGNLGDVNQAESRLAQAEERLARLEGQFKDAQTRFYEIVGEVPMNLAELDMQKYHVPAAVEDAAKRALENSPQMQAAMLSHQASEKNLKVEEAPFYPNLNLELYANSDWDSNGYEEKTFDARGMLVLSYNLYNGGADNSRRKQARELEIESRRTMQKVQREIERQTKVDFQAYMTATETLSLLGKREKASLDALENYKKQQELGRRSLLDVLDVTNELFQAKVAVLDGKLEKNFSTFQLLADMGELAEALGVGSPKQLAMND